MAFTHTTRRGKTYYLHTGPKRGGGIQHFVSTDAEGALVDSLPAGFEIYETPNGQRSGRSGARPHGRAVSPARQSPIFATCSTPAAAVHVVFSGPAPAPVKHPAILATTCRSRI